MHNCLYLALQAGGLSDITLQHLILTLRNRTIHECDLTNVCNALEINIELTPGSLINEFHIKKLRGWIPVTNIIS